MAAGLALAPSQHAALALAVELVNTRPRPSHLRDSLTGPGELATLLARHGERDPQIDEHDVVAVRGLRPRLLDAFLAPDEASLAAILNPLLAAGASAPQMSDHDGSGWHLHMAPAAAGWAEWLGGRCAVALALLACEYGVDRLGECGAADCQAVYADVSRAASRRYCSRTCSTRVNVARHRAGRAAEPSPAA
jgi:hypothetical protein